MIIRIIATALIQCTVRTQAGWITLAVVGTARSSLAARLDMADPWLFRLWGGAFDYTPGTPTSLLPTARSNRCRQGITVTKKRAGLPRLAVARPVGDRGRTDGVTTASGRYRPRGSRRSTG